MEWRLPVNSASPTILYLDLNSCFASIEQQAHPLLRGKPVAVAAYTTPSGCILAPSVEAKRAGVRLGMRVREGRLLCPSLTVLPPDPWKYRFVNRKLFSLLSNYTPHVAVKSIDEMVLDLSGTPAYARGMKTVAFEIKKRIQEEVGDWLTVSIGIACNQWLAKIAASFKKPDGLTIITHENVHKILSQLTLEDLCGIKRANRIRLNLVGIFTPLQFFAADIRTLKRAFRSICAYYWHCRLHGWEIDRAVFARKTYGQSYALSKATTQDMELAPLLCKLVEKMGARMRKGGYASCGIYVASLFRDGSFWHTSHNFRDPAFASQNLYRRAWKLFSCRPRRPVSNLSVACFELVEKPLAQASLFEQENRWRAVTQAVDHINEQWGEFVIIPARMMGLEGKILDRISYGNIQDLEHLA